MSEWSSSFMNECSICFDRIVDYIKCNDVRCDTKVCKECMKTYLRVSLSQNVIPKCCGTVCNRYYVLSNFKTFDELKATYAECCFNELFKNHGETSRKQVEIETNMEALRRARGVFIEEKFPVAIAYTAKMIMPQRLKKLDVQIKNKIEQQTKASKRTCMNLTCSGSLDDSFVCLTCATQFCMECERRKDNNHICLQSDVDSLKSIKLMIKCPECKIPIIRSQGCPNMTCANCGQHFIYTTGEKGGGGGHVTRIAAPKTKRLISEIYADELNKMKLLDHVHRFELNQPNGSDHKQMQNIFISYYKNGCNRTAKLDMTLALAFEKYIITTDAHNKFQQACNELENHIRDSSLTVEHINRLIALVR